MSVFWSPVFFVTALVYSSAGLGGASAYLAFLTAAGVDYGLVPTCALALNVLSASVSFFNWVRYFRRFLIPMMAVSIPASFIGGRMEVGSDFLGVVIYLVLGIVGLTMLLPTERLAKRKVKMVEKTALIYLFILVLSFFFGFIGGMIGIGGGVFLIPVLYLSGLTDEKQAASAGNVFILTNSIAGLIGQTIKLTYIPLDLLLLPSVSVIFGSLLGSHLSSTRLSPHFVKAMFGLIVLLTAIVSFISRRH